jgi:hypothetical protein
MRIRLRAERRLGELIVAEQEAGRLATKGGNGSNQHRANVETGDISTLSDHGIPRDRSAQAQQLARVPSSNSKCAFAPSAAPASCCASRRRADNARSLGRINIGRRMLRLPL